MTVTSMPQKCYNLSIDFIHKYKLLYHDVKASISEGIMKKSRGLRVHMHISNPKITRVSITLAKKDNPDRTRRVSINSRFITIKNGRAYLNTRQIKKGNWAIISSENILIPENVPKMTTSTGPKRANIKKVL
ncbi:TPA: hypothetical protein NY444_002791 [Escherichia coli]|nr:hypothetical protein [Escherichia coli]HCK2265590.1 hypothetical protein [Escherichia coli]